MMGGRIWVESEPGRGSAFHFTIMLGLQSGPGNHQLPAVQIELRGLCALIVDDNATNRRILERILSNWQMKSISVESGPAALATLKTAKEDGEPFDLALLDVPMPEMDGFTVAEQIRQTTEIANTKVIGQKLIFENA